MSVRAIGAAWAALVVSLMVEFAVRGVWASAIGVAAALAVAFTFMRLARSPGLPAAFALASGFWLLILLGLGEMDPATRHDIPVAQHTTIP